jgi:pimeloyl-ACP methyl ester carboxylesterase
VLSSTPLSDVAHGAPSAEQSAVDAAEDSDGLRRSRADFYPADRADLLERYVADALKAGPLAAEGHLAVGSYAIDRAIGRLEVPTLLIGATEDPFAYPELARLGAAAADAEIGEIVGGMVALPDGWPAEFAAAVLDFLDRVRDPERQPLGDELRAANDGRRLRQSPAACAPLAGLTVGHR